jgi:2-(1,2-epoxy-1,2-dihydrophenyl)acetyl-CoA isomerase
MNGKLILRQTDGAIERITLNRPEKLNSFTAAMHLELQSALSEIEKAGAARVLVLAANGRGFCAGQDLAEPGVQPGADLGTQVECYYAPLVRRLRALPMPVVCAVQGVAAGAGANLAFACDIVIAAQSAYFIEPFCKLGLVPDTGGTYFLPRLAGTARAMGIAMLGERISAEQAVHWGLIWKAVPDVSLAATVDNLAAELAAGPTKGLARIKQAIYSSGDRTLDEQLDFERDAMRELGRSRDYQEAVSAFTQKKTPRFTGE